MENGLTQKEREFELKQIIWKQFPFNSTPKRNTDVVNACYRFLVKCENKGITINKYCLVEQAFIWWTHCKESKCEQASKTLYQKLNENKMCFINW